MSPFPYAPPGYEEDRTARIALYAKIYRARTVQRRAALRDWPVWLQQAHEQRLIASLGLAWVNKYYYKYAKQEETHS